MSLPWALTRFEARYMAPALTRAGGYAYTRAIMYGTVARGLMVAHDQPRRCPVMDRY